LQGSIIAALTVRNNYGGQGARGGTGTATGGTGGTGGHGVFINGASGLMQTQRLFSMNNQGATAGTGGAGPAAGSVGTTGFGVKNNGAIAADKIELSQDCSSSKIQKVDLGGSTRLHNLANT